MPTDTETLEGIDSLIQESDSYLSQTRNKWLEIEHQIIHGTSTDGLEDWQAKFNLPVLSNALLAAATEITEALINRSDWYDLDERNPSDLQASELKEPLKKILNYYLQTAHWPTVAADSIYTALQAVAPVSVLWSTRKVTNPEWVSWNERQKNPTADEALQSYRDMDTNQASEQLLDFAGVLSNALGEEKPEELDKEPPRELELGGLHFDTPRFDEVWWEPTAKTINESPWIAYRIYIPDYKMLEMADAKIFKKDKVKEVLSKTGKPTIPVMAYFGPQMLKEGATRRIKTQAYFCYYSNGVILADGTYPFLEIREQNHPVVAGVARRLPYVNYGKSPAEFGVEMAQWYDLNSRLLVDQLRYGLLGLKIINNALVINQDVFDQGIEPGDMIQTHGAPDDVFKQVDLTNNRENQNHPIQEQLRQGIVESIGTGGPGFGAINLRSRTTSREIDALQSRSERSLAAIAKSLSLSFVHPAVEKSFARVIQFGLSEVDSNPELSALLSEEEKALLSTLTEQDRLNILRTFYRFKLRGYKAREEDAAILDALNQFLAASNNNQALQQKINYEAFIGEYTERLDISDKRLVVTQATEFDTIAFENGLLAQNKQVSVSPNDNHELHLERQAPGPDATPAQLEHFQQHQQALQAQTPPGTPDVV